jgi:hypothetical protein
MIPTQEIISIYILTYIVVFYFFSVFQRVKLLYLFRSARYHFTKIFYPYNSDDLSISKINYLHYFYIFFYILINGVIITYILAFTDSGISKTEGLTLIQIKDYFKINLIVYIVIFIRFLIINYVLGMFLSSKLKFIFFKNFIVNIIIGNLMLINFIVYNLNSFYDYNYLIISTISLLGLHFFFQAKVYLSYVSKLEIKSIMYFILYLCAFKLAPWLWLYSSLF